MYKIILILSIIFVSGGCSVFQQAIKTEQESTDELDWNSFVQFVVKQNVTSRNFLIAKARVEINSKSSKESFLANIKFVYPDTFLISLRSKTGIEAVRIFCTKDTVLINDRINRKLFYGKPGIAGRKYGITSESLPLVLGDFVTEYRESGNIDCVNGMVNLNSTIHGNKIKYLFSCTKGKLISIERESSNSNSFVSINYGQFVGISDIYYPSNIIIEYYELKVNIKIDKIEYPWNGNIVFIPGNNYELIELL